MTDTPDEPMTDDHLDDEALSAVIDGELSVLATHASTCATCGERLLALRSAAIAVRQPVTIDPDRRESVILAALAVADERVDADRVPSLAARARGRGRRLPLLAGAAAAVVALLVAVPLARDDGSDQLATTTADQADDTASLRSAAPAPEAADSQIAGAGAAEGAPSEQLGELAGTDLAERLREVPRTPGEGVATCEEAGRATVPGAGERTLVAGATWNGADAVVVVFEDDDGETAVVMTTPDCVVVASAQV